MIAVALLLQVVSGSSDGTALQARIDAVQATADQARAAVPIPCATVPMPDTLTGGVGSGTPCTTRPDATRPTVIQAKTTTTATDSSYSVAFDVPFPATPIYADARIYGTSQPYLCTVQTLTTTGASGKCYQLVATTLPSATTALLGLVVSPFQAAGSGLSVRVVARQ